MLEASWVVAGVRPERVAGGVVGTEGWARLSANQERVRLGLCWALAPTCTSLPEILFRRVLAPAASPAHPGDFAGQAQLTGAL